MSSSSSTNINPNFDEKNRALNELLQLQSALLHGATPDFMAALMAMPVRDSDFPSRQITLFSQEMPGDYREYPFADEKIPAGPLWSLTNHPLTMVGREEKIEMDRIREIQEELNRREKIRRLALELKEAENIKSVMTSGELVVKSKVHNSALEDELLNQLAMKKNVQKKEILPERQAALRLRELTRYLGGSTNRKIMTAWAVIEYLYMNAKESKVTVKTNKQGVEHEARHPALRSSELALILCSEEAKVTALEIPSLFMCLGTSAHEAAVALSIAGVLAALGPNNGENLIHEAALKNHLTSLRTGIDDILISIEELKFVVFPKQDDLEGAKEVIICAMEGEKMFARWIQDKEQEEDVRTKLALQRANALETFMVAWRDVYLQRGPYDGRKQLILVKVVEYCKNATATHNRKRHVDIPSGIIKRLGIEAFPEILRGRLLLLVAAAEAEEARGRLEAKAKATELFKLTIKQVKNDLDDLVFAGEDTGSIVSNGSMDSFDPISKGTESYELGPSLLQDDQKKSETDSFPRKKKKKKPMQRMDSALIPLEPLDTNVRFRLHDPTPGEPTVIKLLWDTAALGQGFDGYAYKDVVMYLQAYASVRMQAALRGFRRRWRYRAARRRWMNKEAIISNQYFHVWRRAARHDLDNRNYLWRKLKAWNFYARRVIRLRNLFRGCFWPFYVWRRWACGRSVAKEKAKFLVTRVMPTLLTLTTFRAWKKYALRGALILRIEAKLIKKKATVKIAEAFAWIHMWARKRRIIRRHWISRAVHMMRKIRFDRQNAPFQVWRMHVYYKKQVRCRLLASSDVFRKKFSPDAVPIPPEKRLDRRARFKRLLAETLNDASTEGGFGLKGGSSLLSSEDDESDAKSRSGKHPKALLEDSTSVALSSVTESQVVPAVTAVVSDSVGENTEIAQQSETSDEQKDDGSRAETPMTPDESSGTEKKSRSKNSSGVNLAASRTSFASKRQFGKATKLAAAAARANLRSRPKFDWRRKKHVRGHEIDSDEELDELLSPKISKCYETILGMNPLPDPSELDFMRRSDDYTMNKIRAMLPKWRKWELYAQIEYLGRFMRWAHRAFCHLRDYARHCRNGRNAKAKYWKKQELRVINRWVNWMAAKDAAVLEASRGEGGGQYSQAEILAHLVRRARRFRMTRRNQKYVEMRAERAAIMQEEEERSIQAKNKRGAKMRAIIAHSDGEPPVQVTAENSVATSVATAETNNGSTAVVAVRPRARSGSVMIDPDETLPRWDEEDRDAAEELSIRMANLSHRMKVEAFKKSNVSDVQNKNNTGGKERIDDMMSQVMKFENSITMAAVQQQEFYAIDFKRHAAQILIDALSRVYEESQMQYIRGEARKYFRTLRMAMMMKRTKAMCSRKKIVNWIRICRRLTALQDRAHIYRSKRLMWTLFNRWLKFVEKEALDCSPNLVAEIVQRNERHQRLTLYLEDMNFKRVVYISNPRIKGAYHTMEALFLRWLMYTQEEKLYRMIYKCNAKLHRLRVMQRCFLAIKTSLPAPEIYQLAEDHMREFFPIVRVMCDLDQIVKRFLAVHKRSVLHVVQHYNRKFLGLVRKDATREMNYKKFKVEFKVQLAKRLTVEQRILSESFDVRGTQDFVDVATPHESKRILYLPAIMQRVDGKAVSDPLSQDVIDDEVDDDSVGVSMSFGPTLKAKRVPGGYKLNKIRLNFLEQIGLVGWQFMWTGDGAEHIESPKRGQWVGGALIMKEITIDKDDFLIGIEYMYEGRGIVSMRFKMHFAGFTSWVGVKASLATLTSYLDVEMTPPQDFEKYISVLPEEKRRPACLRAFIIGFSAVWTGSRLSAISLVVRKIKDQNIFSYFWVQDALDAEAKIEADNKSKMLEESVRRRGGDRLPAIGNVSTVTNSAGNPYGDIDSDDQLQSMQEPRTNTPGSSEGMARRLAEQRKKEKEKKKQEDEGFKEMTKRKFDNEIKKVELTPSDQEFFDLMRMRSTEVTAAEERVLAFSHRLWKDEKIARNPSLKKLVSLPLIRGLSKWLFDVLSKHLIGFKTADLRGSELLDEARRLRSNAASFARKKKVVVELMYRAEIAPRPWEGMSLLSPQLRAARLAHKEKVIELNQRLEAIQQEEAAMRAKALETEKAGRRLLPQIPLTISICNNYRIKIAAARSKAALLQRMDVNVMKAAISNDKDTGKGIISQEDMRLTMHSLKTRDIKSILAPEQPHFFHNKAELKYVVGDMMQILGDTLNEEVERERQRQQDFDTETQFQVRAKNWEMKRNFSKSRRPKTPIQRKYPGSSTIVSSSLDMKRIPITDELEGSEVSSAVDISVVSSNQGNKKKKRVFGKGTR